METGLKWFNQNYEKDKNGSTIGLCIVCWLQMDYDEDCIEDG